MSSGVDIVIQIVFSSGWNRREVVLFVGMKSVLRGPPENVNKSDLDGTIELLMRNWS